MKICYYTLAFMPATDLGGPVYSAYYLMRSLLRRGHEVTVCCTNLASKSRKLYQQTERRLYDGIDVIYFNTQKLFPVGANSFGLFVCPGIIRFCQTELKNYDVVHLDGYRCFPATVVSFFCRKYGIPYVIQARGTLRHANTSVLAKQAFDLSVGKSILRGSALCIASSEDEASQYRYFAPGKEELAVIYNGLDFDNYKNLPPRGAFRSRHGIQSRYLLTYLGRIHPIKGIETFIRAFALSRHRSESSVAIIGPDEGYKSTLVRVAEETGLRDSVIFLDAVAGQEKNEAFVDSDVVVYAGRSESFGMVAFEATMCGTPVITAGNSGCSELLERFGAGHVTEYGDVKKLAKLMDDVLENRVQAAERAKFAAQNFERLLSWDNIAREYENAYRSSCGSAYDRRTAAQIV